MLILTRNEGQTIVIGDSISITVLSVRGKQVKIGIEAPKNISVNRQEIQDRILNEINDYEYVSSINKLEKINQEKKSPSITIKNRKCPPLSAEDLEKIRQERIKLKYNRG